MFKCKMMSIISLFAILSLLTFSVYAIEPPLWPERFSQSLTVDFGDIVTTGKFWYDINQNAQRLDF